MSSYCRSLFILGLFFTCFYAIAGLSQEANVTVLNGKNLTPEAVAAIASGAQKVDLDPEGLERMLKSYDLIIEATRQNVQIYGVNVGVGLNKDKQIFTGSLSDNLPASREFNRRNLMATAAGVGEDVDIDVVRAAMAIRLNELLLGGSGAQPEVAQMYARFLNEGITPILPSRGSVGEGDISILSHIGTAMMGIGEVTFKNKTISAAAALQEIGIEPLQPTGRDSLAIMSSNAYSQALALKALVTLKQLAHSTELVFSLSLEALNGNVAPFLKETQALRPLHYPDASANRILRDLRGSYIFEANPERALQDPLSFRTAPFHFGTLQQTLDQMQTMLLKDINSVTDNPAIVVETDSTSKVSNTFKKIKGESVSGYIASNATFEPYPWSIYLSTLKNVLQQMTVDSAQRVVKLDAPEFTKLSRFLSPSDGVLAFSAAQKVLGDLVQNIQTLAASHDAMIIPMAGGIEDVASAAPKLAMDVLEMSTDYYSVLALEVLHAAQAIDLRRQKRPDLTLGRQTEHLYTLLREEIPFLSEDRPLTPDIKKATNLLQSLPNLSSRTNLKSAGGICRDLL